MRVKMECARRASVGVGCGKVGKGEVLAYRVWDFSFFAWRSDFLSAGGVLVNEAGGGEEDSEGLGLGRGAVTAASAVLIFFFNGFASVTLGARLRAVRVGCAFNLSSCLICTGRGSRFAALFDASALELRVLFFFGRGELWWLFAAEARVAARAIAV
jgi:hypothetical protein